MSIVECGAGCSVMRKKFFPMFLVDSKSNPIVRFSTGKEVKVSSLGREGASGIYSKCQIGNVFLQCVQFKNRFLIPVNTGILVSRRGAKMTIDFPLKDFALWNKVAIYIQKAYPNLFTYNPLQISRYIHFEYCGRVTFTGREQFSQFFEKFGLDRLKLHMTYIEITKFGREREESLLRIKQKPKVFIVLRLRGDGKSDPVRLGQAALKCGVFPEPKVQREQKKSAIAGNKIVPPSFVDASKITFVRGSGLKKKKGGRGAIRKPRNILMRALPYYIKCNRIPKRSVNVDAMFWERLYKHSLARSI